MLLPAGLYSLFLPTIDRGAFWHVEVRQEGSPVCVRAIVPEVALEEDEESLRQDVFSA